jgi:hypothetical protein
MNDVGGVSVVGLTSGGHFVTDIQMMIPHKVGVFIPIEKYLKSKDLHRAINSGIIFKLDSVIGQQQENVGSSMDTEKLAQLELENARLKEALEQANQQNVDLKSGMTALQGQMSAVLSALGRIEAAPKVIQQVVNTTATTASGQTLTGPVSEAVGGDAPMFLPDLSQDLGEARINITESTSSEGVTGAASRLREFRKKTKG